MITRNKTGTKLVLVLLFTLGCPARKDLPLVEPPKTILEEALLRTVIIHYNISDSAKGTGVLLDAQGTVLTCHHVVFGWQDRLRVSQDSKHFFDAHVIREEPAIDLVLLKTDLKMPVPPFATWIARSWRSMIPFFFLDQPGGWDRRFSRVMSHIWIVPALTFECLECHLSRLWEPPFPDVPELLYTDWMVVLLESTEQPWVLTRGIPRGLLFQPVLCRLF